MARGKGAGSEWSNADGAPGDGDDDAPANDHLSDGDLLGDDGGGGGGGEAGSGAAAGELPAVDEGGKYVYLATFCLVLFLASEKVTLHLSSYAAFFLLELNRFG